MRSGFVRAIWGILLLVMMTLPVVAKDFSKGFEAYQRGDYVTAISAWRPLAEQGNVSAQGVLGFMYRNGQGVAKDYVQAHMWFALAAQNGDRHAAGNRKSLEGHMTPGDIAKAQKLAHEWIKNHKQN